LLSNALKFSNEDSDVKVNVNYLDNTNEIYCEVLDSGVGISPSKTDTIFEAFEQEDSSTTRKYGGTGLGLSIVKQLVELMGGKIGVNSELGVGSTFYFTLPIIEAKEDIDKDDVATINQELLHGNALIVEDNKTNQMLLSILLEDFGLTYDVANDGLEAVDKVKNNKYDLILMDENMPNMNGIEASSTIRKLEHTKDIVIIAVTANALKGDREKFLENGMDDYISKPIDTDELEKILRKYCNKKFL
jgi:CheY-like chemotaxis protein